MAAQAIDGIMPTTTGGTWQQGAWYQGRQYWNGTLSPVGVINQYSDQIGAGKPVSAEVNAASAKAQGVTSNQFSTYLDTQRAILANTPAPQLSSTNAVQNYTNLAQNGFMANYTDPNAPKVQTIAEIKDELMKSLPTEKPTAPNLVETYNKLTSDGTITALEKNIVDLKAQKADALAQLEVNKTAERSKPVAQNVIEGRISTEAQQAQEKVDFIDRQLTTAADELTMRYKTVETIMTYTQKDFENAKSTYDSEFTQALDLITQARGIQQDQITVQQKARDNARANLQIFVNAITSGNMDVGSLSPDMAATLNAMELSAGLPMGFVQSLHPSAKDQILHINDSTGEVLMSDGNGGFKTVKAMTATKSGSGGTSGLTNSQQLTLNSTALSAIKAVDTNGDKSLSLPEYQSAVEQIMEKTGVDFATADNAATEAFNNLNFTTWHWKN